MRFAVLAFLFGCTPPRNALGALAACEQHVAATTRAPTFAAVDTTLSTERIERDRYLVRSSVKDGTRVRAFDCLAHWRGGWTVDTVRMDVAP